MDRFYSRILALGIIVQIGALGAEPLNQWHWRNPLPTGNTITAVIYANGEFTALDDGGEVLTSVDGVSWTVRSCGRVCYLGGIAYGNDRYVAVGGNYHSSGGGGLILTSPDGIVWTEQVLPVPATSIGPLRGVTYGNGTFVAVGQADEIFSSPDGVEWTIQAATLVSQLNFVSLYGIAYGNGTFVAVGDTWTSFSVDEPILTSPDGTNWSAVDSGIMGILPGVNFLNGAFVAVGSDISTKTVILVSSDGTMWTNNSFSSPGQARFTTVSYGAGTYVAAGTALSGGAGVIYTSPDAHTWTRRKFAATSGLNATAYGVGTFVATGAGTLLTSTNGIEWTGLGSGSWTNLAGVVYAQGEFVAVGDGGTALRSTDGLRWTSGATGISGNFRSIACGGGVFVATGDAGAALTSTNGVDWEEHSSGVTTDIVDVCYGNGTFAAVTPDGDILTSSNGTQWVVQNSGAAGAYLSGVAFGPGRFVAVGALGSGSIVLTSSDGLAWASHTPQVGPLMGVCYGGGMFVAVGTGTIATSADGINWTMGNFQPGANQELYRVGYAHGTFVIVGQSGAIFSSTNGLDWAGHNSGSANNLRGVAYGGRTFVTVGDAGVILQSDPLPIWGLRLIPVVSPAKGLFTLEARGPANQTWEIDTSTNLSDWIPFTEFWSTNQMIPLIDLAATNYSKRFYRGQTW
ncbi:MAG TPA: hypothetical protein VKY92_20385 [Verrucomicrobiae bacterium]|nr:hypothetical protein [Verrucomicrobiae bacterium]